MFKSVAIFVALAITLVAGQSYFIELPTVFSSSLNITVNSANALTLLGNYYADQSNLVARLDSVGVSSINYNSSTVFAHSTIVDVARGTGYEIIESNGTFECTQQKYENPFDPSQNYYEKFVQTTYFGNHLVDYVVNKSNSDGVVISAWVDRFLQVPVGVSIVDGPTSTLAMYDDIDTSVPETACLSGKLSKSRKLAALAETDKEIATYMKFVDRIFPRAQ